MIMFGLKENDCININLYGLEYDAIIINITKKGLRVHEIPGAKVPFNVRIKFGNIIKHYTKEENPEYYL